ncbi:MAG TPA: hypothetical protein VFC27_02220 [Anaerovoracaceae bacterium]|nr:hypothetical protein [Anaerovoracaceae bacterium]
MGKIIEPEEKFKLVHYDRKIQNEGKQYPIDILNFIVLNLMRLRFWVELTQLPVILPVNWERI